MITIKLDNSRLSDFIDYCRKYGPEHDDSFLTSDELGNFTINEENPTYILINESGDIVGAASLMIDSYFRKGRKGRFRIMHSLESNREAYLSLLQAILPHAGDIDRVFLFLPEKRESTGSILISLGFSIERYSYLLVRDASPIQEPIFPEGYELKHFEFGMDEEDWCLVRNLGFAKLAGSETPMTPEMVSKMKDWDDFVEGGMMLLYHNKKPVGLVRAGREAYEGDVYTYIGPIAVIPEYQGIGLGRNLLRAALLFGFNMGMPKGLLTVNAENDRALQLYLDEGFKKKEVVACYNYSIRPL